MAPKLDDEIYKKSGSVDKHLEGVKKQYDTKEKLAFYEEVMGDGTNNIHFGKWDGIDLDQQGAYGKASDQMTHYMFDLAIENLKKKSEISYVDLGSGTGAAAMLLLEKHDFITKATCLNLCNEQNALATSRAKELGLSDRMQVITGTYEDAPQIPSNSFDVALSQDAFVHAFSKLKTFQEALRVTKPGGVLVFCDLMCGNGPGVTEEELATFAQTNMVNDWLSPQQNVDACKEAGWKDVEFINLTGDIRISFQLMLKKVERICQEDHGMDEALLLTYKENLARRILQVDRGVFQWGVIHAKKEEA